MDGKRKRRQKPNRGSSLARLQGVGAVFAATVRDWATPDEYRAFQRHIDRTHTVGLSMNVCRLVVVPILLRYRPRIPELTARLLALADSPEAWEEMVGFLVALCDVSWAEGLASDFAEGFGAELSRDAQGGLRARRRWTH